MFTDQSILTNTGSDQTTNRLNFNIRVDQRSSYCRWCTFRQVQWDRNGSHTDRSTDDEFSGGQLPVSTSVETTGGLNDGTDDGTDGGYVERVSSADAVTVYLCVFVRSPFGC